MKQKKAVYSILALYMVLLVQGVLAEQFAFVGHRAAGMGGANAATVNDSSAQWHNPAAFGFFNREPDPVTGPITNAVTNVVMEAINEPDTNAMVVAESTDTNLVAEAEITAATNTLAEAENTDTNGVADADSMDALLSSMEAADEAATNTVAGTMPITNEAYEVTYEVTIGEIIPEKAWVDNGALEKKDFGWNFIGSGAGYTMTEDMPEYITQVGRIDFDAFDGSGVAPTIEGVESMLLLGSSLYGLGSNPDNAFYVDATAGMNFRIGHVGFGIRAFGEVAGFVDYLDTANLGVEQDINQFVASINSAAASDGGFNAGTWTYQSITAGDLTAINGVDPDAELYIDYQLTQLKNDGAINQKNVDDAVLMANLITYGQDPNDPNSTSYDNNKSTVTARGFGLVEVPISYGYAFNDNLSIGVTAKGMYGTVTGTKVRFVDGDSFDSALDTLEENSEASFNFGLDLGVLYRMKRVQFGAVAHNINAPKFDGFIDTIDIMNDAGVVVDTVPIQIPDYKMDPQITLGAAYIPSERFMLEMSYDLLETGTLMGNYNIQRISFGGELDLWLLALRLGMYNNLAADWQDWIATAGVGMNLWAVRVDVGGAYSIGANAEYEGSEIPEEARFYAALSLEF